MNKDTLLTLGLSIFGIVAMTGLITYDRKESRTLKEYVMAHPDEYKIYTDYSRTKKLEDDNKTLRTRIDSLSNNYDKAMTALKKYVDAEKSDLESTKKMVDMHFDLQK